MKNIFLSLICIAAFNYISAINWVGSAESGIKKSEATESPILIYFYAEEHPKSDEFQIVLESGRMNFLNDNFIMAKVDISDTENLSFLQSYAIRDLPVFILEDHNPQRQKFIPSMEITPIQLFSSLYDIYTKTASAYIDSEDYDSAYGCLKLIEDLPGTFGENVNKSIKLLEPKLKKKHASQKNDNLIKAESYMITAENNVKKENYEKAYVYFRKVIELVPNTELSLNAKKEQDKIKDLVDKSVILK